MGRGLGARKTGGSETRPYVKMDPGLAGSWLRGRGRLETGPYVRLGRRDGGGGKAGRWQTAAQREIGGTWKEVWGGGGGGVVLALLQRPIANLARRRLELVVE